MRINTATSGVNSVSRSPILAAGSQVQSSATAAGPSQTPAPDTYKNPFARKAIPAGYGVVNTCKSGAITPEMKELTKYGYNPLRQGVGTPYEDAVKMWEKDSGRQFPGIVRGGGQQPPQPTNPFANKRGFPPGYGVVNTCKSGAITEEMKELTKYGYNPLRQGVGTPFEDAVAMWEKDTGRQFPGIVR